MKAGRPVVKKSRAVRQPSVSAPTLEKVIGTTAKGNNSIAYNNATGDVAYVASGVVVFYNPESNKQIGHLVNSNAVSISCVAFSSNGELLATGEGSGRSPEISIWNYTPPKLTLAKSLKGHKYGID